MYIGIFFSVEVFDMKKRGVILLLGIFVISSLIVVFNSYNVSSPIISDDKPVETKNSFRTK